MFKTLLKRGAEWLGARAKKTAELTVTRQRVPTDTDIGAAGAEWDDIVTRNVLPTVAESVLDGAMSGDLSQQSQLFNSMLDTWDSLANNAASLGDAVVGAPWELKPFADADGNVSDKAKEKHALCEAALCGMRPDPSANELDGDGLKRQLALGRVIGHEVSEILWEVREHDGVSRILPRAARRVSPSYYGYESMKGRRLRFRPSRGATFTDFPENKFLIQITTSHGGHPAQAAPARTLVKYWGGKTYGWEWLIYYAMRFGSPFRWATYKDGKTAVRDNILTMLGAMGNSGYGAFPEGTKLELAEASKSAGDLPYTLLMKLADQACDLVFKGEVQSSGTDGKTGFSNGEVQSTVRRDRLQGHCNGVCTTLQQLVRMTLMLNYGDDSEAPEWTCEIPEPEDAKKNADTDAVLNEMGVPQDLQELMERHNKSMPADGEPVLINGQLVKWDPKILIKDAAEMEKQKEREQKDAKAAKEKKVVAMAAARAAGDDTEDMSTASILQRLITAAVIEGAETAEEQMEKTEK